MALSIALLIYVVVQFVAFLLVLVATPIDMYRIRRDAPFLRNRCITLWGIKFNCSSNTYEFNSDDLWSSCPDRRDRFRAAQALALISVFVYGAAFVLGVIMMFCCRCLRWVCLALNSVGAVTVSFVVVVVAMAYHIDRGDRCQAGKMFYNYGAGFILLVLALILDVLNIPVLLLLCQDSGSVENAKTAADTSEHSEDEKKEELGQA